MNYLSLFSGAGGSDLGAKLLNWKCAGYVEYEPYCQKVLRQRIADGILDAAPIFGDIRKFISEGYADAYQGMVDIVTGGFPCQDISIAGKQAGIYGERSGLWKEMSEVIGKVRPHFAFVENSANLVILGLDRIVGDFTEMGYSCQWGVMGAFHAGFPHGRERVWIMAHTENDRCEHAINGQNASGDKRRFNAQIPVERSSPLGYDEFRQEVRAAEFIRKANGLANRMDRIKAIGNGQVPLCMAYAFSKLFEGIIE